MSACTGECCRFIVFGTRQIHSIFSDDREDHEEIKSMLLAVNHDAEWVSFTCRNWDPDTRLCLIYDQRPAMCSRYPYDGVCGYCGLVGPECEDPATARYVMSGYLYPLDVSALLPVGGGATPP